MTDNNKITVPPTGAEITLQILGKIKEYQDKQPLPTEADRQRWAREAAQKKQAKEQKRREFWEIWRNTRYVKVWEAVALALDIEPQRIDYAPNGLDEFLGSYPDHFKKLLTIALRNISSNGPLKPNHDIPPKHPAETVIPLIDFGGWVVQNGLIKTLPSDFPREPVKVSKERGQGMGLRTIQGIALGTTQENSLGSSLGYAPQITPTNSLGRPQGISQETPQGIGQWTSRELPLKSPAINKASTTALGKSSPVPTDKIHPRAETSYLNIIGAFLELILKQKNIPKNVTQEWLMNQFIEKFPKVSGLSRAKLSDVFAKAKQSLLIRHEYA